MSSEFAVRDNPRFLRNAVVLGLLTAIGPFAIDMYLPSLPSVGQALGVGADTAMLSLTGFFATFALGQMIYGPISDMIGRKTPLYFGILLFLAASVGCALASDIDMLIGFRMLQGLGGAAGIIISRAIVRDLHSGVDEARLLSLLMLVLSVSPLLAPLFGSLIIAQTSWRGIFWFTTLAGLLGLLLAAIFVKETRPRELRAESDLTSLLAGCRLLFADRNFLGLTAIGALAISSFFVFLSHSSFVLMGQYGLSPTGYSIAFSVNAAAFFAAMQFNGWLGARFGLQRLVRPAVAGYAAAMTLLLVLTLARVESLAVLGTVLFIGYGFVGILLPVTSVLAMADHGAIAGTASSLMGTIQLAAGAVIMAVSGAFVDGTALPMVAGIAGCAILSFLAAQFTMTGKRPIAAE
ncbi:MAG TPA: multidrug effflux MFS transporter [Ferrovibrio sp.]|uniref:multidrug effflux MFS transporter n=1 Tax=Ferrovibrio sp. TaxID=1917215 RepID=UPI002ED3B0DD